MAAGKKIIRYRGQNATVKLFANMNIAVASQFYDEVLAMLERDIELVTFDGADVEAIDTSAFQVILALIKALDKKSVPFLWKDASSSVQDTADGLGLLDSLAMAH